MRDSGRPGRRLRHVCDRTLTPTFQAHHGFRGAAFLGRGPARTVLTLWSTTPDIEALERSVLYRKTVDAIMSTGFILRVEPALTAEVL
jgi:hypothetical protein